jgi:prefoldin subunit 5
VTREQEVQALRAQAQQLQQALEQINKRLGELELQQDQPR